MIFNISFNKKLQLLVVELWIKWLNFWLMIFQKIFFKKLKSAPNNILIYKIGNIGDIVCAIPAFIAVRRAYPSAKITLLTSPGERGALGAKELLANVIYFDELTIYYSDNLDSFEKKIKFARDFKKNNYDLFVQLPDDLVNFRTLLRNMIFAKIIGVKSAFGFKIRTVQLFKKNQVDYLSQKTEVESLLSLLRKNNINSGKIEYDFNIPEYQKRKVEIILERKWGEAGKQCLVVAISAGGKRETNQWPKERFKEVVEYLSDKYNAKIVIVGGVADIAQAKLITQNLRSENYLIVAGEIEILGTIELLKHCSFLISNSTGTIHLAAAVRLPVVGIYGIRDILGRWLPYGSHHKILYHKLMNCDYKNEDCIRKSIEAVSVKEVKFACDQIIADIKFY
ncbi:MAG: glycosyltransferase family 9 protein [Patescibacteria group bacterium]